MISLDSIEASLHSIKISDGTNDLLIDGSGHLSINDGGNSLTIDNADLSTLAGAVSGTEMQVDVLTMPTVTVTATDLDCLISHAESSIKIGDGTDFLAINADGTIDVNSSVQSLATWKSTAASVTSTSAELVGTPLASRKRMLLQNLGTQDIYVGEVVGVTTSTGTKVPKGASFEMDFDANANIFALTSSGTSDVRIAEFAL